MDLLELVLKKYKDYPEFMGLEISGPNQRGAVDDTLLHLAARLGAVDDMKILVDAGADVNATGDLGNTPLHQAAMMGQTEAVKFLLRIGAKKELRNEFEHTPLDVARLGQQAEIVRLFEKGACGSCCERG